MIAITIRSQGYEIDAELDDRNEASATSAEAYDILEKTERIELTRYDRPQDGAAVILTEDELNEWFESVGVALDNQRVIVGDLLGLDDFPTTNADPRTRALLETLKPSQLRAIARVVASGWDHFGDYAKDHEVKSFRVSRQSYGGLSVVIEFGSVGDEHSLASVFCRSRAHVFVGPRGRVTRLSKNLKIRPVRRGDYYSLWYEDQR